MIIIIAVILVFLILLLKKSSSKANVKSIDSEVKINNSNNSLEQPNTINEQTYTIWNNGKEVKGKVIVLPQGLQVFDEEGDIILDVTDRLTKVLGTIDTGTTPGRITNSELLVGTPWIFLTHAASYSPRVDYEVNPHVSISGDTISWYWDAACPVESRLNFAFIYGVY